MSQFVLPCACGAQIPVNRSQAGMSLPCPQCGKPVEVPTIRKLAEFASGVVEKKDSTRSGALKWLTPVAAVSFIVGLIGLSYAGYLYYERYTYLSFVAQIGGDLNLTEEDFMKEIRKSASQSPPADTWDYWNTMLYDGLKDASPPELFRAKRYLEARWPTLVQSFLVGLTGLGVFGISSFAIQKRRKVQNSI